MGGGARSGGCCAVAPDEMTRGQYWALCGAVALSVLAYTMARRAAQAAGVQAVPWMQQSTKPVIT